MRALITLAGKIDPSVQAAMLKASNMGTKSSGVIQKAFSAMNKSLLSQVGKINPKLQTQLQKGESMFSKTFGAVKGHTGKGIQGITRFGDAVKAVAAGSLLAKAVTKIGTSVMSASSGALQYASDLTEVQNVVDTTFGKGSSLIEAFSKKSLQTYGLSTLQAKQYSSTLGAMYKSMGLSSQQTLTMSQNMTALAGDMASFYNLNPDEAFEKIRAGVSGETEPLKQLGINMDEANLQAFAMSKGIKTSYQNMSQAQQAALRYNYLLNVTKDAQGDFAKTSGSFANQQRLLKENLQQVAGTLLSKVTPALGKGLQKVNAFITGLNTNAVSAFVGQIANMAVSFLPLVMQLLPQFGCLLQMVLPPLVRIGQQIIPVIVQVIGTVMMALRPLIPPIMQFVQALLPPLVKILTAVAPLLIQVANITAAVLGPALTLVVNIITKLANLITAVAKPIGDFFGKVGPFLGIGGQKSATAAVAAKKAVPAYAQGGFADSPSIFGEAGLEAAIPIRPGNSRSMGLLAKTAQLLGMRNQYGSQPVPQRGFFRNGDAEENSGGKRPIYFTYAPVFNGNNHPAEGFLRRDAQDIDRILDDYFGEKGRLAWEQ